MLVLLTHKPKPFGQRLTEYSERIARRRCNIRAQTFNKIIRDARFCKLSNRFISERFIDVALTVFGARSELNDCRCYIRRRIRQVEQSLYPLGCRIGRDNAVAGDWYPRTVAQVGL